MSFTSLDLFQKNQRKLFFLLSFFIGWSSEFQVSREAILCSSPDEFLLKHKESIMSRFTDGGSSRSSKGSGGGVMARSVLKSLRCVLEVLNFRE